jgi:hypothetical protein
MGSYRRNPLADLERDLWKASQGEEGALEEAWQYDEDELALYLEDRDSFHEMLEAAANPDNALTDTEASTEFLEPLKDAIMEYLDGLNWEEDVLPVARDFHREILENSLEATLPHIAREIKIRFYLEEYRRNLTSWFPCLDWKTQIEPTVRELIEKHIKDEIYLMADWGFYDKVKTALKELESHS